MHSTTGVPVRRSRATSTISAALAALLLAACTGGSSDITPIPGPDEDRQATPDLGPDEGPEPEEPEEVDEPEDPFAVPDDIDEDYVEAVLNEILAEHTDLVREVLSQEPDALTFPTEDQSRTLLELFDGPQESERRQSIDDYLVSDDARTALLPPDDIGSQRFEVESVERADPGCVVAVGWYDLTEMAVEPFPREVFSVVALKRDDEEARFANATGWKLWDGSPLRIDGEPVPLEEIIGSDFSAVIDTACGREDAG